MTMERSQKLFSCTIHQVFDAMRMEAYNIAFLYLYILFFFTTDSDYVVCII